jgi:hypothetical protein
MTERPSSFPIRYSRLSRVFFVPLLLGERHAEVSLTDAELRVRMGWAFRATIPRRSIRRAARRRDVAWAIGVHFLDTRLRTWLVNGSSRGIVFLDLEPPARGRTGPFPITIQRLGLGLEDPDAFVRDLGLKDGEGAPPAGGAPSPTTPGT